MTDARTVASTFDSGRLILARQAAKLRKNELADHAGVSAGAISQYELGQTKPKPTVLAKIALATGMPIEFFASGRPIGRQDTITTHFRSLRSTTQLERSQALAQAEFTWEIACELERHVRLPDVDVPTISLPDNPSVELIEAAAEAVREQWDVPEGPIPNVVRLLESKGVVVAKLWSDVERVDAFCHPFPGRPVVILYADKQSKDRSRFAGGHELGHLVMHQEGSEPGNQIIERQAHAFAAAFLMPAEQIFPHLPSRVDWRHLLELKQTWGTSMASLLFRARTLGAMSEATYRRAVTTMASRGWNRQEEGSLGPSEQPTLLARAMALLDADYSLEELATNVRLSASLVASVVWPPDDRPAVTLDDELSRTRDFHERGETGDPELLDFRTEGILEMSSNPVVRIKVDEPNENEACTATVTFESGSEDHQELRSHADLRHLVSECGLDIGDVVISPRSEAWLKDHEEIPDL